MMPVEFLEFLGRAAELIFSGDQPLVNKLQRLLRNLLKIFCNHTLILPNFEN